MSEEGVDDRRRRLDSRTMSLSAAMPKNSMEWKAAMVTQRAANVRMFA